MQRNQTYTALTLRVHACGEHREAWFLSAETGILKATIFGGPKSHLRAYVAPFHQGKLLLYHDPVKDSYKVTDFDVRFWRQGIHEQYKRLVSAQSLSETILASYASGGDWHEAFKRADSTLNVLAESSETLCRRILIHFLWNWIKLLGLEPELEQCSACGAELPAAAVVLFSVPDAGALCSNCLHGEGLVPVSPGARRWLSSTEAVAPGELARYGADTQSLSQAKSLVTGILAGALGRQLKTWDLW